MELHTAREVINALGGVRSIADITGRTYDAAWNWTRSNHFPCNTYEVIRAALKRQDPKLTASPKLWGMIEP